jgi:hypothetical protein
VTNGSSLYSVDTLHKDTIHILNWMEQDGVRVHLVTQNSYNLNLIFLPFFKKQNRSVKQVLSRVWYQSEGRGYKERV